MSAKPTPEPWRVKPTDRHKVEGSPFEEGTVVASCWTSSFAPPPDEAAANAARIAACVNACAGIPTEILATDGFSVVEALRHRDALLAAAERIAADMSRHVEHGGHLTDREAESLRLLTEAADTLARSPS